MRVTVFKVAGLSLAIVMLGAIVQGFFFVTSHAINVHSEVRSVPSDIAMIVDKNTTLASEIKLVPSNIAMTGNKNTTLTNGSTNILGEHPTALVINTDIEFGTVFPGETQQGVFTIFLNDTEVGPGPYTRVEYHLVLQGKSGYLDLSPYLTVKRDPTEADVEPDEPFVVAGSSVDSSTGDIGDRWLVTLNLPDAPAEGDYWSVITVWVDGTTP